MLFSSGLTQVDERKLYQLLNFILNDAESHELDVIRAALRKREGKGLAGDSRISERTSAGWHGRWGRR